MIFDQTRAKMTSFQKFLVTVMILLQMAITATAWHELERQDNLARIDAKLSDLESKSVKFQLKSALARVEKDKDLRESLLEEALGHANDVVVYHCNSPSLVKGADSRAMSKAVEDCRSSLLKQKTELEAGRQGKNQMTVIGLAAVAAIIGLVI